MNQFVKRVFASVKWRSRMAIVIFVAIVTLCLPSMPTYNYQYEVGKKWQETDLNAPFDFPIRKTEDSIANEKLMIKQHRMPIFRVDSTINTSTWTVLDKEVNDFYSLIVAYKAQIDNKVASNLLLKSQESCRLKYNVSPVDYTHAASPEWKQNMREYLHILLNRVYQKGLVADIPIGDLSEINAAASPKMFILKPTPHTEIWVHANQLLRIGEWEKVMISEELRYQQDKVLVQKWMLSCLKPNIIYDDSLTQMAINQQIEAISPIYGKIAMNTSIIKKDDIITPEKANIIRSFILEQENRMGVQNQWKDIISRMFMVLIISSILFAYLRYNRIRVFYDTQKFPLILSVVALIMIGMSFFDKIIQLDDMFLGIKGIFIVPSCIVPIVISHFFDSRTSSMSNFTIALFGGVLIQHNIEYAFIQIVVGTVAVYSLRFMQRREAFFLTLLHILSAYLIAYLAYQWYSGDLFDKKHIGNLLMLVINASLSIFAYPIVYVLEKIFRTSSALSYLELSDTNHPLLHKLSIIAPGTFQHSLQVANIAKATIQEIGGNALLTYVGGLYHDIGKIKNMQYFAENIREGENPHAKISPEESAAIIIEHVSYGLELAKRHKLPPEIIDFIQTHHGKSRVEYFYRQYLAQHPHEKIDESLFTYKGEKPTTKETAVIMIADSIEAASRSLKKISKEDLAHLVNKIIDGKIQTHQLDNSTLTFKDISVIRKNILAQLQNIYHSRIEYPA